MRKMLSSFDSSLIKKGIFIFAIIFCNLELYISIFFNYKIIDVDELIIYDFQSYGLFINCNRMHVELHMLISSETPAQVAK